jgi:hypothetical protein
MDEETVIKELERVLTIDGIGRPAKARLLLQLLPMSNNPTSEIFRNALAKIAARKHV